MAYKSSKRRWVANDRQCCLLLLPVDGVLWCTTAMTNVIPPKTNMEPKNDDIQLMLPCWEYAQIYGKEASSDCSLMSFSSVIWTLHTISCKHLSGNSAWGHSVMGYRSCHSAPLSQLGCSGLDQQQSIPEIHGSLLINVASIILLTHLQLPSVTPKTFSGGNWKYTAYAKVPKWDQYPWHDCFLQHDPPGAICRSLKLWDIKHQGRCQMHTENVCRTKKW